MISEAGLILGLRDRGKAMDLLTIWGVTSAVGMVFKPILEELAKDASKDWVKDFFKGSWASVTKRDPLDKAAGQAIKAFCELVQDELEELGLEADRIKGYLPSLRRLIRSKHGREVLGSPFREEWDLQDLLAVWRQLRLDPVPEGFDWLGVQRRYLRMIQKIQREDPELQRILDSEILMKIAAGLWEDKRVFYL